MRRFLPAVLLLALAALAPSCSTHTHTRTVAPADVANLPPAGSPEQAVRKLEQAWNQLACDSLPGLFADDFLFVFAGGDSAGSPYALTHWTREDELAASCNLFAKAQSIDLSFDRTLVDQDDERPGRDPRVHRAIRTGLVLTAVIPDSVGQELFEIRGFVTFHLVRGDSAAIPPDQAAQGVGPDSTRWWIEGTADETLPVSGLRANPAAGMSWGHLKALFR